MDRLPQPDDGYNVIAAPFWQQGGVHRPRGRRDKTPRQDRDVQAPRTPLETLGLLGLHPALTDRELFNIAVNSPWISTDLAPSSWASGTFRLRPSPSFPNDKWWGRSRCWTVLIWREMGDGAERAAFKNGELDSIVLCWPGNPPTLSRVSPVSRFAPVRRRA